MIESRYMDIRKGKKEDAKEISELVKQSILATHTEIYPQDEIDHKLSIYSEENVKEYIEKGEYFVAEEDGKIIGCVLAKGNDMRSLYIDPKYMRKGLGTQLAQIAEDCIRNNGNDFVDIWASLVSVDFYKKRGFKIMKDIVDDKGRVLHKKMRKILT